MFEPTSYFWSKCQMQKWVPKVRTLVNFMVDYFLTSLAGKEYLGLKRAVKIWISGPWVMSISRITIGCWNHGCWNSTSSWLRNILEIHFQSITALMSGGYFMLDAPTGFAIEVWWVLPMSRRQLSMFRLTLASFHFLRRSHLKIGFRKSYREF